MIQDWLRLVIFCPNHQVDLAEFLDFLEVLLLSAPRLEWLLQFVEVDEVTFQICYPMVQDHFQSFQEADRGLRGFFYDCLLHLLPVLINEENK